MDTNGDGAVSPLDALLVINYLNGMMSGEGEARSDAAISSLADDMAFDFVEHYDEKDPEVESILDSIAEDWETAQAKGPKVVGEGISSPACGVFVRFE